MNKEKLWLMLMQANPEFSDSNRKMSLESVRNMFDVVWNAAFESGAKQMIDRQREIASAQSPMPEFFAQMLSELMADDGKPKKKKPPTPDNGKSNPPQGKP
jgi:hypothetical protein